LEGGGGDGGREWAGRRQRQRGIRARHVSSRHEGGLAIDSELGVGTRVCLRFELVRGPFEPDSG